MISSIFKGLFDLTKFRAGVMIVFVSGIGYLLAETDEIDWLRFFHVCLGIGIAGSGALALNQFMERKVDALMVRTKNRPLPSGRVSPGQAFCFGLLLMLGGYAYLWHFTTPLCCLSTVLCGISYLFIYTPLKRRSSMSTFAGSIPGALLPMMGWLGKGEGLFSFEELPRAELMVLYVILLFIWQIPLALIISIRYKDDYQLVGMKQLPFVINDESASRHILLNTSLMCVLTILPWFGGSVVGNFYLISILFVNAWILFLAVSFFKRKDAKSMQSFYKGLLLFLPLFLLFSFLFKS